jgi:hypothetical protein
MQDNDIHTEALDFGADKKSKFPLIVLGAGVLGVLFGLTAIIMANKARLELNAEIARSSGQRASVQDFSGQMLDLQAQQQVLREEIGRYDAQLKQQREQTQLAFNTVSKEIKANRDLINAMGSGQRSVGVARSASSNSSLGDSGVASGKAYTIQAGDTFSKIAKEFSLSLDALIQANPGVDPRKLKVGQEIRLP